MKKYLKTIFLIFIIPIVTGIISGVITSKVENIDFVSALSVIIKKTFSFILKILTLKISIWIVLIILFVVIGVIKILNLISDNNNDIEAKKEELKKVFKNYTEDYYDGIKYVWDWYEMYNGIKMTNLHPVCECGCDFK